MNYKTLLPNRFKKFGWLIFILASIIFFAARKFDWQPTFLDITINDYSLITEVNLLKEFIFTFWMIGLIMITFSKEKQEDEFISYLRLTSWQYAVMASLIISIIGTWSIFGWNYLIFSAINMLTVPLLFMLIFNLLLYRNSNKQTADEK
ncbi:hypothetical protein [Pedobacter sp.]|uniref:hypothetical protein n=1 Tax=Pedobacter sp. TaxID=1411316 RepID=UPI003D7FE718